MATIKTDKLDYRPGDEVAITADGFTSGATVIFEIQNLGPDGILGTSDDFLYTPWSVLDGSRADANSLSGSLGTTWRVPGTALDSSLLLTAREAGADGLFGTADDVVATTTFHDAKPGGTSNSSANLDQWATGPAPDAVSSADQWVNGNLNANQAHYSEDFYIPYRTVYAGLKTGTTYYTTIQWDVTKAGKHALDYIGTFDKRYFSDGPETLLRTASPSDVDNVVAGVTKLASGSTTLDIIADPEFAANAFHAQEAGEFTFYGAVNFIGYALTGPDGTFGTADDLQFKPGADGNWGTADDVIPAGFAAGDVYTYTPGSDPLMSVNGSATRQVTVLFDFNGGGGDTSAVLAWGGHIASSFDWGEGNSAVEIPGSPYHTAIDLAVGINNTTGTVSNLAGHQDRSLASSAVIPDPPDPPTSNPQAILDDDALPGGDADPSADPGDDPNALSTSGTLSHDYGLAGPGSTLFLGTMTAVREGPDGVIGNADDVAVVGFSASLNADGTVVTISQLQGGVSVDVVQVSLTNTVDAVYSVVQLNTIDHPSLDGSLGDNTENNVLFTLGYRVMNKNGEFADGSLQVNVDDDIPAPPIIQVSGTEPVLLTFDGGLTGGNFDDDPNADGDANAATASASFASLFSVSAADPGADGGSNSATSYNLELAVAEGSNSGLLTASTNTAVKLYDIGGVIYGSTWAGAITDDASIQANKVFTLAVNSATGSVTQTQFVAIENDNGINNTLSDAVTDDDLESLANGLVLLRGSATTSDIDGDVSAAGSSTLDLGGNVRFADDGPTSPVVTVSGTEPVLLTFDGGLTGGNFDDDPNADGDANAATASASFASLFSVSAADPGADGGSNSATSYNLELAVAEGSNSGLLTASTNTAVKLYDIGGVIYGSTWAGAITDDASIQANQVFTLAVGSSTGLVAQTQFVAVEHDNGINNTLSDAVTDNDLETLANGLVLLRASATTTDNDGDVSAAGSSTVDLGGNVSFADDGPTTPVVTVSGTEPVLLTFDGGLAGGNFDNDANADGDANAATASASFASLFSAGAADPGADGGSNAAISYSLELAVAEGTNSGLLTATTNTAVKLYAIGGVIYGSTWAGAVTDDASIEANKVFTLAVNSATGSVTQTQFMAIEHDNGINNTLSDAVTDDDLETLANGLVLLRGSAATTDNDGDVSAAGSNTVDLGGNVTFGDDGPDIVTSPVQDTTPTLGATEWIFSEAFAYAIGADQHGPSYSETDSDFTNLSLAGFANDAAIGSPTVTWASETDAQATFDVSFNYDDDRDGSATQPINGQLVFDKDDNTYTLTIDALSSSQDVTLGEGTGYETYDIGGTTPSSGPSPIATGQLGDGFFIQIRGFESPLSAGGNTSVADGELVTGTVAPVTLSSVALGVSGNTIQSGEAANLRFFETDPKGNVGATDFAFATDFFIKFDGFETENDDLILVLDLVDASDPTITTTRALYVDQTDVYESDTNNTDLVGTKYQPIVSALDNNDALLIVESNDYNVTAGDDWILRGLQILSNDAGLTGPAINLNRDVGDDGGSSYAVSPAVPSNPLVGPGNTIQEDSSTGPIKVIDAGFSITTTTPPSLDLELTFTVVDADGDATGEQTIDIEQGLPAPVTLVGVDPQSTIGLA